MNEPVSRRRRLGRALRARLCSRRLPPALAITAVVLTLPALGIGWQMDDHFQRLVMLERGAGDLSPMAAFSVLDGDTELNRHYRDLGYLPWWTPDDFRLAFLRPLAIATLWLDYQLWPDSSTLMHGQSLLWFAALVAATALLYRRIIEPAWVGGLAALLFTLDDAHASPAAWLANRNALLATLFGVLCLVAHDRWRRDNWRPGAWIAPVLLALGLLSGEIALATTGYLFAHALFLEPGGPRRRGLRSLWPCAVVVAGWAALYVAGGYGAFGSGLYLDPLRSPVAYLQAVFERAPLSLMGQWTPLPAEIGALLPPDASHVWWLVAVVLAVIVLAALVPELRGDHTARFWGLGMALSLLPISATFPSNRLLLFVGLGAMGLLARFLETTLARGSSTGGWGRRFRLALAWAFVVSHLGLAPLLLLAGPAGIQALGDPIRLAAASLGTDRRIAEQDLIVTNAPDYLLFVTNLPTLQALEGRPIPRRILALSTGPTPIKLSRSGELTLRVELERGLFAGPPGRLLRDPESSSTEIAARLEMDPGMHVKVLKTVNSASYGLSTEVNSLLQATNLLGRARLESIVVAIAVKAVMPKLETSEFDLAGFWRSAA
ncbi:MAG: HDOD domain-containing protein, partial [bacterium]|nr:HDOD domain-containing protein [bacterium]